MAKSKDLELTKTLAEGPPPRMDSRCKVRDLIENHPNGQDIRQAIESPRWPTSTLAKVLRSKGVDLAANTIATHRNGKCVCTRKASNV